MTRYGSYTPKATIDYESKIYGYYMAKYGSEKPFDHAVMVTITFEMGMPKSWSKTKRGAMCGMPCEARPDLDNLVKSITDALNKVAYNDDSQIACLISTKKYADKSCINIRLEDFTYGNEAQ